MHLICPKCKSRAVGRIGQNQYYCWDCNIEFVPTGDGFRMYRLEADGTCLLDSLEDTSSRLTDLELVAPHANPVKDGMPK